MLYCLLNQIRVKCCRNIRDNSYFIVLKVQILHFCVRKLHVWHQRITPIHFQFENVRVHTSENFIRNPGIWNLWKSDASSWNYSYVSRDLTTFNNTRQQRFCVSGELCVSQLIRVCWSRKSPLLVTVTSGSGAGGPESDFKIFSSKSY